MHLKLFHIHFPDIAEPQDKKWRFCVWRWWSMVSLWLHCPSCKTLACLLLPAACKILLWELSSHQTAGHYEPDSFGFIFRYNNFLRPMCYMIWNVFLLYWSLKIRVFNAIFYIYCYNKLIIYLLYIVAFYSLVVYTMGPIRSRPFTMALHSLIGAGFLAGTFLVKPFLPEQDQKR